MNYWAVRAYNYYYGVTHVLEHVQMSAPALKDLWPGQSVPLLKALHILTPMAG